MIAKPATPRGANGMAPPSILQVMDNPALFGREFEGTSWDAWRVFLAALSASPMTDDQLEVYRRHTGRSTPPTAPFREAELVVGRRGGKSRILALLAVYAAAFFDYTPYLAAGEVATIAVIAADRKQARGIFRFVKGFLGAVPTLAAMIADESSETIALKNRVVIEIATASFRVTRGYTYCAVLADETAFFRDETGANPDVEIFRALRPGLATIPGALLINASSPYRRAGLLWKTYQRHFGRDDAKVLVWQGSTVEMNPVFDRSIEAEAYEEDPESAASEYGAQFRSDLADFVPRAVVEACIEPGVHERPRAGAGRYVAFIDAAGGSGSDSMTLAIAHQQDGMPVLDAIRERRPPFSPDDVVGEFSNLIRSYGVRMAQADRWGGDWVVEAFRKQGVNVQPSARPKSEIYAEILPSLNAHRCQLLDHPRLVSQLCSLERRTARSGKDSIDHPPKGHDDVANAAAGALLLASEKRRAMPQFTAEVVAKIKSQGGMGNGYRY